MVQQKCIARGYLQWWRRLLSRSLKADLLDDGVVVLPTRVASSAGQFAAGAEMISGLILTADSNSKRIRLLESFSKRLLDSNCATITPYSRLDKPVLE